VQVPTTSQAASTSHPGLTLRDGALPGVGLYATQAIDEFSFPESPWAQFLENVEPLDAVKRLKLLRLCALEGLSMKAMQGVEEGTRLLQEFEKYGKPYLQTPVQRSEGINEVATLAKELCVAIEKVRLLDQIRLWEFWPKFSPNDRKRRQFRGMTFNEGASCVDQIWQEVNCLEEAASKMHTAIGDAGKSGGRKSTLPAYAEQIDWIWNVLWPEDIELGRGGKFERICEACFEAAGVHAKAAGAVRYYIEKISTRAGSDFETTL
jgi:hypothetical protein